MSKMNSVTMTAEQLGVSRQTVLRYIKIGRLKASKYLKEYRITQEEIERLKNGETINNADEFLNKGCDSCNG